VAADGILRGDGGDAGVRFGRFDACCVTLKEGQPAGGAGQIREEVREFVPFHN
jgi:hypothetical protein